MKRYGLALSGLLILSLSAPSYSMEPDVTTSTQIQEQQDNLVKLFKELAIDMAWDMGATAVNKVVPQQDIGPVDTHTIMCYLAKAGAVYCNEGKDKVIPVMTKKIAVDSVYYKVAQKLMPTYPAWFKGLTEGNKLKQLSAWVLKQAGINAIKVPTSSIYDSIVTKAKSLYAGMSNKPVVVKKSLIKNKPESIGLKSLLKKTETPAT